MTRLAKPSSCCSQYPSFPTAKAFRFDFAGRKCVCCRNPTIYSIRWIIVDLFWGFPFFMLQDGAAVLRGLWEENWGFRGPGGHSGVVWWSKNQPHLSWAFPLWVGQGDILKLKWNAITGVTFNTVLRLTARILKWHRYLDESFKTTLYGSCLIK